MKEKLTLTVEGTAIARARAYVKKEGTSLSKIVEQLFQRVGEQPFGEKWKGKFHIPKKIPNDPRSQRLWAKYLSSGE